MLRPTECWNCIKKSIKPEWKTAFVSAFVLGLLVHMPVMLRDIPNHDGLDSMYFDQNMITSGRWFLSLACGLTSYYTLPWLIGLLSVCYLGLTSVFLTDFLKIKSTPVIVLVSGLTAVFPALASTFAYVFTMDGYMLALLLAVLSVWLTERCKRGFLAGAVCLALSLGIYQAYLSVAVLLCIYGVLMIAMGAGQIREKLMGSLRYLYMGVIGVGGYFVILQIMLKLQGQEMSSYHGGNSAGTMGLSQLLGTVVRMYTDFGAFTLRGKVLFNNYFSGAAMAVLAVLTLAVLMRRTIVKKWWKSIWFYLIGLLLVVGLPFASNMILLISPEVTYHALMRYQYVLYPILMIAFISADREPPSRTIQGNAKPADSAQIAAEWLLLLAAAVLVWNYTVTDQISYSNLEKRYEKTYAYCVRLLDRIEQTEGYYQGIPIAMIGVVGDESYPGTDITGAVTDGLIGLNGDSLLYTGNNYELFIKHYLGATLNILPAESMAQMYYDPAYREMESFPGKSSIRIIDGIMYIKTENIE